MRSVATRRAGLAGATVLALLAGCSSSPPPAAPAPSTSTGSSTTARPSTSAPPPVPAANPLKLSPATVAVPAALRQPPFDRTRRLQVPAGWVISVFARIPRARFMALLPDGGLLVSRPATGEVLLVRRGAGGVGTVSRWVGGLKQPHDILVARLEGQDWVYIAESDKIRRYPWRAGDARARAGTAIITGLPDADTPGLNGQYAHPLKNMVLGLDQTLYVAIGSSCNACVEDTRSEPRRGAVYKYDPAGGKGTLVSTGLRNAEGLAVIPGTGEVWAVVNNRDNIAFPNHRDSDRDGRDDYGKVLQTYVDFHPPENFVHVVDGAFYGWPFCNPDPDRTLGMQEMPYDRDVQLNPDGKAADCDRATKVNLGLPAHTAPLGLTFLERSAVPEPIRSGAVIAFHGSWNSSRPVGYRIGWYAWDYIQHKPVGLRNLVTGWAGAEVNQGEIWGRPVDVIPDRDGSLLISDDQSGTVYRLSPPK